MLYIYFLVTDCLRTLETVAVTIPLHLISTNQIPTHMTRPNNSASISIINKYSFEILQRGRRDRDRMVVGLQLPMKSVPITIDAVSSNPVHGEVYSIQHCVIKFVSDLRKVGGNQRPY